MKRLSLWIVIMLPLAVLAQQHGNNSHTMHDTDSY